MKIYNMFLLLVMLVGMFGLVSAEDIFIKQTTQYDLRVPCFNNGSLCSSSASCNITITEPDGETLIQNQLMTNQNQFHNKTLLKSQTTTVGKHLVTTVCQDGIYSGFATFDLTITPSGTNDNSLSQLILMGAIFLFIGFFIFLGFKNEDAWMILFAGIAMFLLGGYILLNGLGNYRNNITHGLSFLISGIGAYLSIRSAMEAIDGK